MTTRIKQEHKNGCGAASLAMITGVSYADVIKHFSTIDFDKDGLIFDALIAFLVDNGFAVAPKFKYFSVVNSPGRNPWPPEPFADIHFCNVLVYEKSPMSHIVVMLKDGTILDPLIDNISKISDYFKVYNVTGIYCVKKLESLK